MIVGYNTDVNFRGEVFHIQTEDKGKANPTVETLVYHSGEILLSRRISYGHMINKPDLRTKIKTMMKNQHEQVINELKEGKYIHLLVMDTQPLGDDFTLDEMVLDYFEDNPV